MHKNYIYYVYKGFERRVHLKQYNSVIVKFFPNLYEFLSSA